MPALVIILSILVVIVFLLLSPVNLYIDYGAEKTIVWARYLFFKIPISPRKKKKTKAKKANSKEKTKTDNQPNEKKENFFISTVKEEGVGAVVEIITRIVQILKDFSSSTLKHLKINKLKLNVITGGQDASDTALNFGYACSVIYPTLGALSGLVSFLKTPDINIAVDYNQKQTTAIFLIQFKMKLFFILAIILKYGIKGILLYMDITKSDPIENKTTENKSA